MESLSKGREEPGRRSARRPGEQILPPNARDSTTTIVTAGRAVQSGRRRNESKKTKEKGEPEGWMKSRVLYKWMTNRPSPPLAVRGPVGMEEAEAGRTVGGAQRPQQEAKGTRRTRSSVVQARPRRWPCTERWLLFARTPGGRGAGEAGGLISDCQHVLVQSLKVVTRSEHRRPH